MLKISILALGNKMPQWVLEASKDYAKRCRDGMQIQLIEIPLTKRNKASDLTRILEKESALIKNALPNQAYLIALDLKGQAFSSEGLALKVTQLQQEHSHLCFLIGGPEGLTPEIVQLCHARWSLSKLTLPHPLVRIILLETLYRSWSIINNHPYHK